MGGGGGGGGGNEDKMEGTPPHPHLFASGGIRA